MLEPIGRNTAPAIAAAAFQCLKDLDDSILLVLSADHIIQDIDVFHQAINIAKKHVQSDKLVTFGIVPTDANTEYGYIKKSKENYHDAYKVEEFIEKPNLKTAQLYLDQKSFLWNSGMFMFKAKTFIEELKTHAPDIALSVNKAVNNAIQDLDFIRLETKAFELSPSDSIDYALMEKSKNVMVVQIDAGWKDIGTWTALYDIAVKDSHGNVIKGDVVTQDTTNSFINAGHHLIAVIGVDNLIIIDTPDATLITSQNKVQEVKNLVESLQASNRHEAEFHRKVHRPWGWYDSLESGQYFQVKRLHLNPGAKLSLQMHNKRAEHWIVINGEATVTNDKKIFSLKKGESTFIPQGTIHALENQTNEPIEIIEVQSGTYLGEDDIVRFEDIYGRITG